MCIVEQQSVFNNIKEQRNIKKKMNKRIKIWNGVCKYNEKLKKKKIIQYSFYKMWRVVHTNPNSINWVALA
jgi:quinolinate synthase